jgi:hypothetical protein
VGCFPVIRRKKPGSSSPQRSKLGKQANGNPRPICPIAQEACREEAFSGSKRNWLLMAAS